MERYLTSVAQRKLRTLQLGFVTPYDARNVRSWSGTPYHMAQALSAAGCTLEYLCPLERGRLGEATLTAKKAFYRLLNRKYLADWHRPGLRRYAEEISRRLVGKRPDFLLSTVSYPFAYLDTEIPFAYWCDATFASLIGYYRTYTGLCAESVRTGLALEKEIFSRARLAIYSSEWAAESALATCGGDRSRVRVVSFGANVECNRTAEDIRALVAARSDRLCRLLFVGVDWVRKGGDTALAVAAHLHGLGVPVELTLVGSAPPAGAPLPSWVRSLGFISKASAEGRRRLEALFAESHFLLLPSQAECTAIVFSEAASFGLPCLATATGGTPTIVRDGHNGWTFAPDAPPARWAEHIAALFAAPERYGELARSAFEEYRTRLNWTVAAATVERHIREAL
jgi:glycosyltransferase involved in cell wall biosynthesis